MTKEEIIKGAEAFGKWYHQIQLVDGYQTPSVMLPANLPYWQMIRAQRSKLDYTGKTVLDIGTMDGMWAFEAEQLGAGMVMAVDIWQNAPQGRERVKFAKAALSSKVTVRLADVCALAKYRFDAGWQLFDIVQCLGLLYHVENPLLALTEIRKCIAPDGKLLVETACWNSGFTEPAARFNSDNGVYHDATTFWVPNWACLKAMLVRAGFKVVGETLREGHPGNTTAFRVAFICEPT